MRTEECDNACYLPFWVTNPLITKCKVATRNPGPILLTQMQITASVCQPMTIILEGLLEDQSQVRTQCWTWGSPLLDTKRMIWIFVARPWTAHGMVSGLGPSRGKWTWVWEKRRPQQGRGIYRKKAVLLGMIIISRCTAFLHNCFSLR